jgi:hypothetical protein
MTDLVFTNGNRRGVQRAPDFEKAAHNVDHVNVAIRSNNLADIERVSKAHSLLAFSFDATLFLQISVEVQRFGYRLVCKRFWNVLCSLPHSSQAPCFSLFKLQSVVLKEAQISFDEV